MLLSAFRFHGVVFKVLDIMYFEPSVDQRTIHEFSVAERRGAVLSPSI